MFEKLYDGFKVVLEENFREKGVKIALEDEYDEAGLIKQVPVIKIECTDFYPAFDQPSTGEKEIETRWQLRHILSKKEKNIEAKARDLSLKLMLLFDDRVFTEYTYPAKYVNSMDDNI
ncbi:MAG: hypothetical protein OIF32_02220, partial [Campylobacterales bacterium]|nr:hypothetical protein [Campylobacterales bacterium]